MYLFCISCKQIVATIKVPTLVTTQQPVTVKHFNLKTDGNVFWYRTPLPASHTATPTKNQRPQGHLNLQH